MENNLSIVKEKFKELPQIEANDLAELKTIGQIIDHLENMLSHSSNKNLDKDLEMQVL